MDSEKVNKIIVDANIVTAAVSAGLVTTAEEAKIKTALSAELKKYLKEVLL